MRVSYQWLQEFFSPDIFRHKSVHDIAEILNQQGLEVAAIKYWGDLFSGVVVGEILTLTSHPNADKLMLCQVSDGVKTYQVICGAHNVTQGAKVAFAKPGACLVNDFKIKKATLRGIDSYGMLCSEQELGLATESDGILILPHDVALGQDFIVAAGLDDYTLEIEVTPNRGDCLSMLGVAREVAAALDCELQLPNIKDYPIEENANLDLNVQVENQNTCLSYRAVMMAPIGVQDTSFQIKMRLMKAGFRSIHWVVDITNYVLLELGHPMHAFDYDTITDAKIVIRDAKEMEKIIALDHVTYALNQMHLVIADTKGPIAIAGIIGGMESGVTESTRAIVFESAFFDSVSIRKTSKKLGLYTESSYRFERGVSWEIQELALKRAIALTMTVSPHAKVMGSCHVSGKVFCKKEIKVHVDTVNHVLGYCYDSEHIITILKRLMFGIRKYEHHYLVRVPSYRNDINAEIDIIEEIVRIDGYDKIPISPMFIIPTMKKEKNEVWSKINIMKRFFSGLGFYEAINYAFVSKEKVALFGGKHADCFQILNPIVETEPVLATSRLLRLIDNAVISFKRAEERIMLFEIGKCFTTVTHDPEHLDQNERYVLAGVLIGRQNDLYWNSRQDKVDFYYTKGVLSAFLDSIGLKDVIFEPAVYTFLEVGESANISVGHIGKLGFLGKLSRVSAQFFDIKAAVYVFEIDIDPLVYMQHTKQHRILSYFPIIERDLSLIIKKTIIYQQIYNIIIRIAGTLLQGIKVFDIYEGDYLEPGYKTLSLRLYFQSKKKTLSDTNVNVLQNTILQELEKNLGITLRP